MCGIAKVLALMSQEDKDALLALLNAPISGASISRELQSAGYVVSLQIVQRHRARTCSC